MYSIVLEKDKTSITKGSIPKGMIILMFHVTNKKQ